MVSKTEVARWLMGMMVAFAAAGCTRQPGTEQARAIYDLYTLFTWIAAGVFATVSGLVLWSIVRYRRRGDDLPPQVHGNTKLELLWTAIPTILVLVLFVATLQAQHKVQRPAARPVVTIEVTAFQWQWRFDYPDHDISIVGLPGRDPEMVVPVGQPVRIRLGSADVVHGFYVYDFLFKRQAIPGTVTEFDLTVDRPGVYRGQCSVFCGLLHDQMRFTVRALPPAQFQRWLRTTRSSTLPGKRRAQSTGPAARATHPANSGVP